MDATLQPLRCPLEAFQRSSRRGRGLLGHPGVALAGWSWGPAVAPAWRRCLWGALGQCGGPVGGRSGVCRTQAVSCGACLCRGVGRPTPSPSLSLCASLCSHLCFPLGAEPGNSALLAGAHGTRPGSSTSQFANLSQLCADLV